MSQSESHQEEEFTDFRSQHQLTVSKEHLIPWKRQAGDQHRPVAVPVDVNVGGSNNPTFLGPVDRPTFHITQNIHIISAGVNPETNRQAAISRGHHETEKDFDEISLDKIEKESEISTPFSRNTVWKATYLSPSGRRTVAVKNCARFKREEALILQKLRHPNIIEFLGVAPLSFDGFAIVAEFAEKGSVYDLIKQHCDDWAHFKKPRWIKWAVEMARGLHYIHQQKYQHGDVKSQNMVITRDDTLKICDFGNARHCESTFTTENIRGSWAWMAPEVIGERHNSQPQTKAKVTHKSDVFSYAVVVWELLTGKEPFAGETTLDFMQATGGQRRRLEIPTECPQTLRDLLTKCWDHDHTKRPRMDEILSRSEQALLSGEWTTCAISKRLPRQDFQISQSGSLEPIGEALRHVALDDYAAQKEDEFGCTASPDTPPSESGKEMIRPVKSGHSMPVTSTASASDSPQSVVVHTVGELEGKSLTQVLQNRKRLELTVKRLESQSGIYRAKMGELQKEQKELKRCQREIEDTDSFQYEIEVVVVEKILTDVGVLNCERCKFMCHYSCRYPDNQKRKCHMIDRSGRCMVCPNRCIWSAHVIQKYRYWYTIKKEKKTFTDIEKRYRDAAGKKLTVEDVIGKLKVEIEILEQADAGLVAEKFHDLEEIALKPKPIGLCEYIDLLIEYQQKEAKPGWKERVELLQSYKGQNSLLDSVNSGFRQGKQKVQKAWNWIERKVQFLYTDQDGNPV